MNQFTKIRLPLVIVWLAYVTAVAGVVVSIVAALLQRGKSRFECYNPVFLKDGSCVIERNVRGRLEWYDMRMRKLKDGAAFVRQRSMLTRYPSKIISASSHYRRKWTEGAGCASWYDTEDNRVWRFYPHRGRVEEYDLRSCRLVGTLGPDGYRRGDSLAGPLFNGRIWSSSINMKRLFLACRDAIFVVNLKTHSVRRLFHVDHMAQHRIAALMEQTGKDEFERPRHEVRGFALVRGRELRLVTPTGETLFRVRFPTYGGNLSVGLGDNGIVMCHSQLWRTEGRSLHYVMVWARDGSILKTYRVWVPIDARIYEENWLDQWMLRLFPPGVSTAAVVSFLAFDPRKLGDLDAKTAACARESLLVGVFCAFLLWALALRDGRSAKGRAGWATFGLLFSALGVLAYLGLRRVAPFETCRTCGKRTRADQPRCSACGAELGPPPPDGTEVFVPDAALASA